MLQLIGGVLDGSWSEVVRSCGTGGGVENVELVVIVISVGGGPGAARLSGAKIGAVLKLLKKYAGTKDSKKKITGPALG